VDHPADPPPSIDGGITPAGPARHQGSAEARQAIAAAEKGGPPAVFWVAPRDERLVLPNTLLLAVRRPGFCSRAARAALEARGVIVGLGAAARDGGGAVAAMGVPAALRGGASGISCQKSASLSRP